MWKRKLSIVPRVDDLVSLYLSFNIFTYTSWELICDSVAASYLIFATAYAGK